MSDKSNISALENHGYDQINRSLQFPYPYKHELGKAP